VPAASSQSAITDVEEIKQKLEEMEQMLQAAKMKTMTKNMSKAEKERRKFINAENGILLNKMVAILNRKRNGNR
jgi:RNA-splicing ligase RtcB